MLGEKVGNISGPTAVKTLPATNGNPTFETTAAGLSGTLAGVEVLSFSTYSAEMIQNVKLYG
ncbi:MAG: hypothetical protein MK036_05755 [Dehalococcoidia bacterium]|nr:hypothetical protein [Dehalococcoidia bacterium]